MKKNKALVFLILSLFILSNGQLFAQQHPNMFLNTSEIAAITAKIAAEEEPWASAYNVAVSRADAALNMAPISIWDGGSNWETGVYDGNGSGSRHDYRAVGDMSHAIRDLGIAYAFSGNEAYADKAIALIHHWCLDPVTAMKPRFNGGQSLIELTITLPAMFYGADMMWNYAGWDSVEKADFISWVATISAESMGSNEVAPTNNFGTWRLMFLASSAAITDDPAMMTYVVDFYKVLLPFQIHHTGFFPWEFNRTDPKNGLFYSTFSMVATAQICEIVRHHGTDLYNWEASNGNGSIKKGFDYMASFVKDPSTWAQTDGTYVYTGENAAVYELAYSIWQKPEYLAAINQWGRPMYGTYVQGPLTLTHAFRGTRLQYNLSINTTGNGSVSGAGMYDEGSVVSITATPEEGWRFDGWSGGLAGNANPENITMDADETVTANFSLTTSVANERLDRTISIIPNPTSGVFVIHSNDEVVKKVVIYNQLGQRIKETINSEVDLSTLPASIYFVKITTLNGKTVIKKVQKK